MFCSPAPPEGRGADFRELVQQPRRWGLQGGMVTDGDSQGLVQSRGESLSTFKSVSAVGTSSFSKRR